MDPRTTCIRMPGLDYSSEVRTLYQYIGANLRRCAYTCTCTHLGRGLDEHSLSPSFSSFSPLFFFFFFFFYSMPKSGGARAPPPPPRFRRPCRKVEFNCKVQLSRWPLLDVPFALRVPMTCVFRIAPHACGWMVHTRVVVYTAKLISEKWNLTAKSNCLDG